MTEKEKMLAGKLYDPSDKILVKERTLAHKLSKLYNDTFDTDEVKRKEIMDQLIPDCGEGTYLQGPVQFDYGTNTHVGKGFYANFNLTVLDVCPVTIGDNVFLGPNVSILTPLHPLRWQDRNSYMKQDGTVTDQEYAAPITIGDNCWIAGNVTIVGGAKIGNGCVIGAGSVVTGTIPDNYIAYGVPCKPIRLITDKDRIEISITGDSGGIGCRNS